MMPEPNAQLDHPGDENIYLVETSMFCVMATEIEHRLRFNL